MPLRLHRSHQDELGRGPLPFQEAGGDPVIRAGLPQEYSGPFSPGPRDVGSRSEFDVLERGGDHWGTTMVLHANNRNGKAPFDAAAFGEVG